MHACSHRQARAAPCVQRLCGAWATPAVVRTVRTPASWLQSNAARGI